MKALLVNIDEATHRALTRVVPPASRRRAQFLREAVRRAVREVEYARMRQAYRAQPDRETEADDWSAAEEYRP